MAQNTNLNVTPYYDDFDKDKNFYRVLFRPGFPIQARELTTMQSVLQNQVETIGTHLFKDGAMVIPGQVGYDLDVRAILLQESFLGSDVETYRTQLEGTIIEGLTTGVRAKVLYTISATESERGYITLYVKYIDSGDTTSDTGLKTFQINEQLITDKEITFGTTLIEIGTPFAQLLPVNATAVGSTAYISEGVYYIRGHFVNVPSNYLILNQYDSNPSYRVGLEILESIVTPEDDETLNDNAAGTSNYSAPGAHRFKISTQFVKRLLDDEADKDFIELLRINNSKIENFVERTEYSELEKSMARRTFEESGDYVIDTFDVKLREHLDDGFNNGVYESGRASSDGNNASEDRLAIEVSPGKAYIRGYRNEFLTPQYVDVLKPREFDSRQNGIINFTLGNFVKVYDVHGWPEVSGDGVTDAYQILNLYDDWAPNATSSVKSGANRIGRCRVVQMKKASTALTATSPFGTSPTIAGGVYDMYFMDVQMFTVLNIGNAVTPYTAGVRITGKTSGASGFIADTGNNTHYIYLEQVDGVFSNGEILEINGRNVGTLEAAHSYQLTDVRSSFGLTGTQTVRFGCNWVLNDSRAIEVSTVDIDDTTDDEITGFRTRFEKDLRPGDVVTAVISDLEGNNSHRILRVDPTAIGVTTANKKNSVANSAVIFDYADQTAKIDGSLKVGTIADGQYSELVRLRPFIFQKDYQNGELSFDLPEDVMKSLDDESFFVYRNFASKTVTTGSITFTLPESESFGALSGDNYILTIINNGGSGTYANGENVDIDAEVDAGNLTTSFGSGNQSFSISGLGNVATVTLTALVSKNTVAKKIKTAGKMKSLKVFKTFQDLETQPTGLAYSSLYGTRVEDKDISFGVNDVYKIHAIYESYDDNDASSPYVVLTESTFFQTGTLIVGKTSGARGRVISFSNADLKLYYVALNEIPFLQGETINGSDLSGDPTTGIVDDGVNSVFAGSKVITDQFELEAGQRTNFYDVSKLVRLPSTVAPTRRLLVIFDYLIHEASGDYFSAESYSGILYKEIPNYKLDGSIKFIRDQIDFRPAVKELRNGSGTVSAPYYVNCTTFDFVSRVFDTTGGSGGATIFDIMQVDSSFRADYSWYLPRIDKLYLSHDGKLVVSTGVSGYYLIPPADITNAMLLATIEYKPYVFDPERDVLITTEVIRRYTMKDIGDLETRLSHVEYYTSLSLLESQTENTKTYDENGFDRLKNGYVVDDFTDHTTGAVYHPDYKCSLDFREGQLRPQHYTTNVALQFVQDDSTNIVKTDGNVLMLPYEDVAIVTQPYASRTENVNPFNVFTFIGRVDLTPASDDWIDINRLPARVENVEGDFSAVARDLNIDQNGFAPIQWGSWQTNWTGESVQSRNRFQSTSGTYGIGRQLGRAGHGQRRQGLFYLHERRTIRVVNNQSRQGVRTKVVPKIERKSLGDTILSQTAIPWIRSRNIGFNVDRLKPRTRMYAFFDGKDINTYMTPKVIEIIKNSNTDARTNETPFVVDETVIGQTSGCQLKVVAPNDGYKTNPYGKGTETLPTSYASQTPYLNHDITAMAETISPDFFGNMQVGEILVGQTSGARAVVKDRRFLTDNVGNLQGTFFIPDPKNDANPRWSTGTRSFRFTTSETNSRAVGQVDSSADTTYSATGTLQTVRENILAVRNAEIVRDTVSEDRVVQTTRTETRQIGWYDPLAQSFIIEEEGGIFVSSVEIYFNTKDDNIPISMQIRTMENGYPTKTILPFSDVTLTPDQVELSETAAVPTKFTFQAPVYIKASVEYCFVLLSDSNEYKVWISRMGDVEVSGDRTISEQPYAGVLFKSQNASTWTADQYEDLKFTVYRANFTATSGTVALQNTPQGKGNNGVHRLIDNPIQTIKPKLTVSLGPPATQYTFSEGARLLQQTSNAAGTVTATTTSNSLSDTITITDVSGNWLQGSNTTYLVRSSEAIATQVVGSAAGTLEVGDVVTGATSGSVGIVKTWDGSTNLVLHYITGAFTATETISEAGGWQATVTSSTESGDSYGAYLSSAPTFANDEKEILIYHRNHGMHSRQNNVKIEGVKSEIGVTSLTSSLAIAATTISVDNASLFHKIINGAAISDTNPGYIKIDNEIIKYSAISSDGKTITVATSGRGAATTADSAHASGAVVECYNLDGIPLVDINKTHTSLECPWMDTYMLQMTGVATNGIRAGGNQVFATQNVQFETLTPTVSTMNLPETTITARINTTSATSVGDGGGEGASSPRDQASFVNDGSYIPVTLNDLNIFDNPRMVCSEVNENAKLDGEKSLKLLIDLSTTKETLSPVVDLDRCSLITTTNRINEWPGGPQPYGQQGLIDRTVDVSKLPIGDQNDCVYITRLARLVRESKTLRVDFQMSRPPESEVRLYYRAFQAGTNDSEDSLGWTLMALPLQYDSSPSEEVLWKDYYYEVSGLNFNAFQVKIVLRSSSQAKIPLIADLRCIALAT
jgi:hypothetical protein